MHGIVSRRAAFLVLSLYVSIWHRHLHLPVRHNMKVIIGWFDCVQHRILSVEEDVEDSLQYRSQHLRN